MVEIVQSIIEILVFLVKLLVLAIPAALVVIGLSKLEGYFEKKRKLSWTKAVLLTSFIALFFALLIIYAIPYFGVQNFVANDNHPSGIDSFIIDNSGNIVEEPVGNNALVDGIVAFIVSILRIAFVAAVLSVIILPLELLASAIFAKLAKKKSSNFLAFYAATFTGLLVAFVVILAFPWVFTGIAYFIFFS